MSETKEATAATSLRVLDLVRKDERPRGEALADGVGVGDDVEQRYEIDADAFYERGFAIARALRAWRHHSGDGPRTGLPAPSGIEQAVERVTNLDSISDKDFDAAFEKGASEVKGPAAVRNRARAIEAVRLLMTALIRQQAGGPINLHISADEDGAKDRWRLFEPQPSLDL